MKLQSRKLGDQLIDYCFTKIFIEIKKCDSASNKGQYGILAMYFFIMYLVISRFKKKSKITLPSEKSLPSFNIFQNIIVYLTDY